jgi:hypothetical protein
MLADCTYLPRRGAVCLLTFRAADCSSSSPCFFSSLPSSYCCCCCCSNIGRLLLLCVISLFRHTCPLNHARESSSSSLPTRPLFLGVIRFHVIARCHQSTTHERGNGREMMSWWWPNRADSFPPLYHKKISLYYFFLRFRHVTKNLQKKQTTTSIYQIYLDWPDILRTPEFL